MGEHCETCTCRRPTQYSVCGCGAPLVSSLEVPKMEWLCMECGRRYPFFGPSRVAATDELWERYVELRRQHADGVRPTPHPQFAAIPPAPEAGTT